MDCSSHCRETYCSHFWITDFSPNKPWIYILRPYICHTRHLETGNRPVSVANAVLLKPCLRRGTCTNRISILSFLATSGIFHFVLPPSVHLHPAVVLLSSKLGGCLQDPPTQPSHCFSLSPVFPHRALLFFLKGICVCGALWSWRRFSPALSNRYC